MSCIRLYMHSHWSVSINSHSVIGRIMKLLLWDSGIKSLIYIMSCSWHMANCWCTLIRISIVLYTHAYMVGTCMYMYTVVALLSIHTNCLAAYHVVSTTDWKGHFYVWTEKWQANYSKWLWLCACVYLMSKWNYLGRSLRVCMLALHGVLS